MAELPTGARPLGGNFQRTQLGSPEPTASTLRSVRSAFLSLPRWAQFLIIATIARALTFGNPIVHVDEEFYFVTARAILQHGALPFVDVWDRKPIGLFLLYVPPAALGIPLGIWAYQAMALAAVTGTATLIARLATRAGWSKGALAAGVAYIAWLNYLDGQGGQTPVFYNLLMASAASLIAPAPDDAADPRRRFHRGLAAMALVGIALQIKYSVIFEGLFFGLWWMWREWRLRQPHGTVIAMAAALVGVAMLPTAAAWAFYAAKGYSDAFLYANFASITERRPDPWGEQFGNLFKIVLITSPLLSMAALGWTQRSPRRAIRTTQNWLFGWTGASILGLLVFGSWFEHYALPILLPLACCAAGFLGLHRHGRLIALPLMLLVLAGGQIVLLVKLHNRGTPAEFYTLAESVRSGPPGCLYVYSSTSMYYAYSDRCTLSRYVFPSHLTRIREQGSIGADQETEIRHILAQKPAMVVMRTPFFGERTELRAMVKHEMDTHYRLRTMAPLGREMNWVYERR